MVRRLAFVCAVLALSGFGSVGSASGEDRTADKPSDKAGDPMATPSINPLEVPRWMGNTIDHILSGDDSESKPANPSRQ